MSEPRDAQFLPFHSINEFMLDDYRRSVLQVVLSRFADLTPARRSALVNLIKHNVSVQGFRNSAQAPVGLKVRGSIAPFTKNSRFTAEVLQAWMELHPELSSQVYDLLIERGWETLPVDTDRTKLPGFFIQWPEGETYDTVDQAYAEKFPDAKEDENNLRLMVVWVSARLPYSNSSE